jgi:hypothetical protein
MDEHLHAANYENAKFMLANGVHRDEIARRLGMSWDGVEKLLDREAKRRGEK